MLIFILFKLCIFPPIILHKGVCRPCLQTFLFVLLINVLRFNVPHSLLIFSFVYLFKRYKLFVILY